MRIKVSLTTRRLNSCGHFMLRAMLVQLIILDFCCLRPLMQSLMTAIVVIVAVWEEDTLAVRMTDWICRLLSGTAHLLGYVSSTRSRAALSVALSWFQIKASSVSIFESILAHLSCYLLFFSPRTASCSSVTSHSRWRTHSRRPKSMLVVARWAIHTLTLWCVTIAPNCIHLLLGLILSRHRWFSSVTFGLTEEKVLIGIASNLKIDNMTHVFVIFQLVVITFFTTGMFLLFLKLVFLLLLNFFLFFNILNF